MTVCEDLATKAELQELRDQLNAVLGEKEDGTQETLFAKGASAPVVQAAGAVTLLGLAKVVSPNALIDIALQNPLNEPVWKDLANGNAQWTKVKGNSSRIPFPDMNKISKTSGGAVAVGSTGAKVAGTGAASAMVLGTLVNIAGTLVLNKATVDILGARIEAESAGAQQALNQQNSAMLRLYDKHEGDIEAVNEDIEAQNAAIANTQQAITVAQSDIVSLSTQTAVISNRLNAANQTIYELQIQNAEAADQISELETELAEAKAELVIAVNQVEVQLTQALEIITKMQLDAQKTAERVALLEAKVATLSATLQEYAIDIANLQANVADLRDDIEILQEENEFDGQLVEIKSRLVSSKLIIEQYRAEQIRAKGGGASAAIGGAAAAQTGILELTNKLATPDLNTAPVPTAVTKEELLNNPQSFKDRFEELLDRVTPDAMTPEQQQQLRDDFKIDLQDGLNLAIASLLIPDLVDLKNRTSEESISRGVQTGICRSLNGGSCPPSPGNPNPTQGLQGMQNMLGDRIAAAADLAQGAVILGHVKKIDATVHHKDWGLQKIQGFASTAWKATHADKVMNLANTALNIHNAIMLSDNIGRSMAYIADNVLATFGVKDASTGNPIDVGSFVRNKLNSMINQVLGATQADALRKKLAAYNRIYQTGANVLYSVRSIMDSAYDVAETTGEHVSQIGNALRAAGAVRENAYALMPTDFKSPSRVRRRLEKIGGAVDVMENITSGVVDVKSEVRELTENQEEFTKEFTAATVSQTKIVEESKKESVSFPEPTEKDEFRATAEKP